MRLQGKRVLVTGGSEGIGRAITAACHHAGAEVIMVGRSRSKLGEAVTGLGDRAHAIAADLSTDDGIDQVVAGATSDGAAVDVLVNNAGRAILAPFDTITRDDFEDLFALNVTAPYFLTQRLLPHLRVPGASVINISSYFADKSIPGRPASPYAISKGAVDAMTKTLAFELGPRGIRVNAIAPGTTDTAMRRRTVENLPPEKQEELARYVETSYPLGRIGRPEDVAGLVVHLASDEAAWTSGAIIPVDGGYTCG